MGTPLRSQSEDDGSFYDLGGEVVFYLEEGQLISASAGSFVNAPGGASHVFRLDSETTQILNVTAAPRERYFRATDEPPQIGAIPPEAPPTREKIGAARARVRGGVPGSPSGGHAQGARGSPYSPRWRGEAFSEVRMPNLCLGRVSGSRICLGTRPQRQGTEHSIVR